VIRRLFSALRRRFARDLHPADLQRALGLASLATLASLAFPAIAAAQALNVNLGTGTGLTDRVIQLAALLTVLSLAPSIVIMTTSFVRMVVVLSLLRTALGLQQSPPNAVLISLSLFLTAIVMAPTLQASYAAGIKPLLDHKMELPQAFKRLGPAGEGLHAGPGRHRRPRPLRQALQRPRGWPGPPTCRSTWSPRLHDLGAEAGLRIGFLLFVPFLVIDLVVASVLMSMA